MKNVCVIPARMAASRFPGKPLHNILGLPMILHILKRCQMHKGFSEVVVATCDQEIFDAVKKAGGEAVMTDSRHERCTDRVAEAVLKMQTKLLNTDLVTMVQGDEIVVNPDMLKVIEETYLHRHCPVVNLISPIEDDEEHDDPNTVKVVFDIHGRALYMSRAAIPSRVRARGPFSRYQQTGIIGFRHQFLHEFSRLSPTQLEVVESCDMMRVIESGLEVYVVRSEQSTIGVDTPQDVAFAETKLKNDPYTVRYL